MSRWRLWFLIGVASCCSLLAVNGLAQNPSPVAAAEYPAAEGAIATSAAASRWSGQVQIDDLPPQALTPASQQPVVLQLDAVARQLSFYL